MGGRSGGGSRGSRSRAGGGRINADGTISQRFQNSAAFQDDAALIEASRQVDAQRRQVLDDQSRLREQLRTLERTEFRRFGQRIPAPASHLQRIEALERQLVRISTTENNLLISSSAIWRQIDRIS